MAFKFIDLFAGIGGFRMALDNLGGSCVFTSEIDAKAQETYRMNYDGEIHGDIRTITGVDRIPAFIDFAIDDHDILAAGFPCQPFSLAGVSARTFLGREHGLLDKAQGTLFHDIAKITKIKRPKALILENVSNLVNHDKGKTFDTIRKIITDDLGYSFHFDVINSQTLVPQKRRRCFIVALRDYDCFEFPEFSGRPIPLREALEPNPSPDLTLSDRSWDGHKRRTIANKQRGAGFTAYEADLDKPANTIVARYYKDGKECLVPQPGKNPRMLSPRECARLQGFPESFNIHPSKSVAYKQFGNAVPVPVVEKVTEKVLDTLGISYGRQADRPTAFPQYAGYQEQKH
jgi:DNA (cytosine-5)-methyltransferase 1